jgi:uncharacterized membrane protein YagU involved in acid resistance
LFEILLVVGFAIVIFAVYALLSRYVFPKVRVNKWVLLGVSIVIFAISIFIPGNGSSIDVTKILLSGLAAIIFFWFFDVNKDGQPSMKKGEKKINIKAKAKPNRVKNKNNK